MEVITAREFRTQQTRVLGRVLKGEDILISSRLGFFKLTPISKEDTLTSRICRGLQEVKLIKKGKLKGYTVDEILNEL